MKDVAAQFDAAAGRWTEEAYADPRAYLRRRAELVLTLGPPLAPGHRVLDLACGDAGFAPYLRALGLEYLGLDASAAMVEAARNRGVPAEVGDLNEYTPHEPVAATTCFRALYYAADRRRFLRHVEAYTERKLLFDLNPRQFRVEDVIADLRAAGFDRVELRPFFAPQRRALPSVIAATLRALEAPRPLARALLRFRFSYVVAASRRTGT